MSPPLKIDRDRELDPSHGARLRALFCATADFEKADYFNTSLAFNSIRTAGSHCDVEFHKLRRMLDGHFSLLFAIPLFGHRLHLRNVVRARFAPAILYSADHVLKRFGNKGVAAHCHTYLSAKTRAKAELGALGYHPSLLPRHRGRSAIEWALRFGEAVTGGSGFWLNDVVDGGPVAARDFCAVRPGDAARELWARELAPMGLRLFGRVFAELERGFVRAVPQDTALATWEPALDGVPPLWRPDVPQLGTSRFQVVPDRFTEAG